MKRLVILLLCCTMTSLSFSQTLKTSYSAPFDEPEGLDTKVFQCTNGNTLLINYTKKGGIDVDVYSPDHKKIATSEIVSTLWDASIMGKSSVDGIYNINGTVVLFLEQLDGRQPFLYRLIISPETGKLVKEDKVAEMSKYGAGAGYAMAFGNVQPKGFHVEKDPLSDAYAVLAFDGFASETAKRIELIHFDGTHKEIGRSFYDGPENRYKFINYLGMVVRGTNEIVLCTYAYNTRSSGGSGSRILLSILKGQTFDHKVLNFTRDLKETNAIFSLNTKKNVLELLTLSKADNNDKGLRFGSSSSTTYSALLITIDPTDYAVTLGKGLDTRPISKYRRMHYQDEDPYTGMPMDMCINSDGSTTVVMEERTTIYSSRGSATEQMGDIGIVDYESEGTATNGYVVRRNHSSKLADGYMSHPDARKGQMSFGGHGWTFGSAKAGYYAFEYFGTPAGRFVIFNDHPGNFERNAEKSPKVLSGVADANTICYRLTNGEMSKFYFFGAPNDNFDNRLAYIKSGDYSEKTGDYAVMIIEKNGRRSKQARIAWVNLN